MCPNRRGTIAGHAFRTHLPPDAHRRHAPRAGHPRGAVPGGPRLRPGHARLRLLARPGGVPWDGGPGGEFDGLSNRLGPGAVPPGAGGGLGPGGGSGGGQSVPFWRYASGLMRESGCIKHPAGKGRRPPGGRVIASESECLPPGGQLFFCRGFCTHVCIFARISLDTKAAINAALFAYFATNQPC